jgi:hypothetical protein
MSVRAWRGPAGGLTKLEGWRGTDPLERSTIAHGPPPAWGTILAGPSSAQNPSASTGSMTLTPSEPTRAGDLLLVCQFTSFTDGRVVSPAVGGGWSNPVQVNDNLNTAQRIFTKTCATGESFPQIFYSVVPNGSAWYIAWLIAGPFDGASLVIDGDATGNFITHGSTTAVSRTSTTTLATTDPVLVVYMNSSNNSRTSPVLTQSLTGAVINGGRHIAGIKIHTPTVVGETVTGGASWTGNATSASSVSALKEAA